jgi:hypothetical protein
MDGNGQTKVTIEFKEMAPGQVIFRIAQTAPDINASLALGSAVLDWTRDHPDAEVTAVLPIVSNGNTVVIHLWYYKP